jgi:hypothetical protein
MRTLAFITGAAIASSILMAGAAFAWTAEPPVQGQGSNAADLSDNDNFKALQDKVNGLASSPGSTSGFNIYGSVSAGSEFSSQGNSYGVQPLTGRSSGFSYSPVPGFRGTPQ